MRTKYSTLRDEEFLSYLRSLPPEPLVAEMISRLEKFLGQS